MEVDIIDVIKGKVISITGGIRSWKGGRYFPTYFYDGVTYHDV